MRKKERLTIGSRLPAGRAVVVKLAVPHALEDVLRLAVDLIRSQDLAEEVDAPGRLARLDRAAIDELVPRRHLAAEQQLLTWLLGLWRRPARGRRRGWRLRVRVARDPRRDRV